MAQPLMFAGVFKVSSLHIPGNAGYIEIGNRKFLLFEVEQYADANVYVVTDTEEEQLLLEALEGDNPILSDLEIDKILGFSKQRLDLKLRVPVVLLE